MNNMSNLYRQVIMDHYKSPRNKGLTGIGKQNHLRNPSCGDDITVLMAYYTTDESTKTLSADTSKDGGNANE